MSASADETDSRSRSPRLRCPRSTASGTSFRPDEAICVGERGPARAGQRSGGCEGKMYCMVNALRASATFVLSNKRKCEAVKLVANNNNHMFS